MFPTKEFNQQNDSPDNSTNSVSAFESLQQFSEWLDTELEVLVNQFAEFETDKSVRKFFQRS